MLSRALPRAAHAAACAASARPATSASAAAAASRRSTLAASALTGGPAANASAAAAASTLTRGGASSMVGPRGALLSFEAAERQRSSVGGGGGGDGLWKPRAFPDRGQRAMSPLGGVRPLSSSQEGEAKGDEDVAGKEEEEAAGEEGDAGSEEVGEVEALREELAKAEEKLKDTSEKALYLAAEMENVRAIAKRDAESARLYAVQKFAKQLLDVADNLERAIASAREAGSGEGGDSSHDVLLQGVEMTSQELTKVFASQGLEKFGEVKEKFDPHLHDAMFEFADPNQEPGTLGQVLKCGYKLHGRVIRAAQVGTVKAA